MEKESNFHIYAPPTPFSLHIYPSGFEINSPPIRSLSPFFDLFLFISIFQWPKFTSISSTWSQKNSIIVSILSLL